MRVLAFLIFLFITSELFLLSKINKIFDFKREIILKNHKTTITKEYQVIVNILRNLSQNTFRGFINKPKILEAFQKQDREELYKLLKKDYTYLKKLGFHQVHFHLKDNSSFLRMHQPHKYGDNLEDIRYSVIYTNKNKQFIEGLEAGRVVPGYRFVYPLFLKNKYLGSVELSFSIHKIVSEIEKVYNTHTHFLIKKNVFTRKVFDEFQRLYMSSIEHPEYIKLNRSYLNKIEPWYNNRKYTKIVDDGLKTKKIFSFEIDINHGDTFLHKHKVVTFLPVPNIKKTTFAYFVFYSESENLKLIEEEATYAKIISSLVLFLFFIIIYIFYLYQKNITQSRDSLKQLSKGLEKKVKYKTKQLKDLNIELEDINRNLELKIQEEVEKNREKDIQLFLQAKKASMGEMVGAIAHQWRQPLNVLAIRIQKLQYDYLQNNIDEAFLDEFVNENKKTINFMSETIDGFRNFFRIDKEKNAFFVKNTINEVVTMLRPQFEHLHIQIKINGEDFSFYGFKTEFQQVILNLLNNAKDILIDKKIAHPSIVIHIENNTISITDNGGGVPLNIEYKIFDPYFTTKEEGDGTGMGLYLSKMIIEDNMKGKLSLENSPSGATFLIKL